MDSTCGGRRGASVRRCLSAMCLALTFCGTARADDPAPSFWPKTAELAEQVLSVEVGVSGEADEWVRRAWALSRYRSDHAGAAEAADKALAIDPKHYKAHEIAALAAQFRGDYDAAFEHLLVLVASDRPESALHLFRFDSLNLSRLQRGRLLRTLQETAADERLSPLYRSRLLPRIAGMLVNQGKLTAADAELAKLQTLQDWMVIGPFSNEENAGFGREYGPEQEIDYSAKYPGRDRDVSWERLRHVGRGGDVEFPAVMYPNSNVLAYVLSFVRVEEDTPAVVRFGAGNAVKLWVNDQLLASEDEDVGFVFDQYAAPCVLKAGWNKVLFKVCERDGNWRLAARFTAPDGRPLAMRTDAEPDGPLAVRETPKSTDKPAFDWTPGAYEHFARLHDAEPDNPEWAYYLALAQQETGRKARAAATFETLCTLNGACSDHHALLARAYLKDEKPEKALVAMKKAVELEPKHVEALADLGRFYLTQDLWEKSLATLRKAARIAPDWPDAQYYLMQVYQDRGWNAHVWRQAQWLLERKPDIGWVLGAYARECLSRGFRKNAKIHYEKTLAENYDDVSARRALIKLAVDELHVDDALEQYAVVQRIWPLSISNRLDKARLLMEAERCDAALDECRQALDVCQANYQIHRLMGEIHQRLGEDDKAIAAWKVALTYKPDDKWLREYLEFLEPQTIAAFEEYGVGEDEAAEIVKNRVAPADYPKADAVTLLDHAVTEVNEDGSYTSLVHQIVQVLTDTGRQQHTTMSTGAYDATIKRAVVIQPDGTEVEASRVSGSTVKFGQLQVGGILELKTQVRGSANEWLSRHYTETFTFGGLMPALRAQFVLLAPKSRTIGYEIQGDRAKLTRGEFEGKDVYDFRADDVPLLEPESNRPPVYDIVDLVRVTTIPDWDEIVRWEYSLIKDQFLADDAVRRKAAELMKGAATREDKIRSVANFVMQKVQYRQDYDRMIMGMKPHKAGNVLEKEVGDCKDKANLLITMLREGGIAANYATLRTRDAGRLRRDIPSNQCNHAIVYVPDPVDFSHGLWIDGTANYSGVDTLPWQDQGVEALVFKDGGEMVFMETPVEPDAQSVSEYDVDVRLNADGSGAVRFVWNATGQFAASLRRIFENEGLRRQQLEQFANAYYPGSRVSSIQFGDLEDRDVPVRIEFAFDAPNIGQPAGNKIVIQPKEFLQLTRQYANRTERTFDLWNTFTSARRFAFTYRLPEGYAVEALPKGVTLEAPAMRYESVAEQDGRTVRLRSEMAVRALHVPKAGYDKVREFCVEADRNEREPLTLVRSDL